MDPDQPTRRVPPDAAGPPPVPGDPVAVVEDPFLADALRSLRTWVVLVGIVALGALGVGLWALLTMEEETDARRGASVERVERLESRADALESGVDDRAAKGTVDELRDQQDQLSKQVTALEKRSQRADGTDEVQQSVDELQQSVDDLDADVQQLGDRLDEVERRQDEQDQSAGSP
jgi:hypothetical protein